MRAARLHHERLHDFTTAHMGSKRVLHGIQENGVSRKVIPKGPREAHCFSILHMHHWEAGFVFCTAFIMGLSSRRKPGHGIS